MSLRAEVANGDRGAAILLVRRKQIVGIASPSLTRLRYARNDDERKMSFQILQKSKKNKARVGIISTPHGDIHTPAFIPVGTQATVKGMTVDQLKNIGIEALLCNTYHLYLRPGDKIVKKAGGLHKFMNWDRPLFTDSGGFQAFSLGYAIEHGVGKIANIFPTERSEGILAEAHRAKAGKSLVKITEDGVEFRSHIDGSKHLLTPEKSIKIQKNLGADIIFAFDECTSPLSSYEYTKKAMERTHRWAERSMSIFRHFEILKSPKEQQLFGIVQGGEYKDLRIISSKFIGSMDFAGFGIGGSFGASYGDSKKNMHQVLDWTAPLLPEEKPKHLLGIGGVDDIYEAVKRGIDTFDCVAPTRLGRNGSALLTTSGSTKNLNLKTSKLLKDKNPIDKKCQCYTCQNHSRAYLSHLFRANEMLGPILTTIHNLYFMERLMEEVREKI